MVPCWVLPDTRKSIIMAAAWNSSVWINNQVPSIVTLSLKT